MQLSFFGGASGIGASCLLVRTRSMRVVVDCGLRQGGGDALPDLGGLQQALGGQEPDLVVLTHAHLDHSGALPLLHQAWPRVRILCTAPTAELVHILLHDATRVMDLDRDQEIPLYGQRQVEATLAALRAHPLDEAVEVGEGRVRLLPAGHIMGAASIFVEDGRRSVLVTGDISLTSQASIPGMPRPRVWPEAVVVESTYGDRLHTTRTEQERRLCEQVSDAVQRGGHVLVPAFALGRAQEVLLSLAAAMRGGRIPRFPVHADGMVRAVCTAYSRHPAFLSAGLRRLVHRQRDPFFPDDLPFQRVRDQAARQAILSGPPCCVVASSGMLAGGASPVYARAWAGEPESLIAITGYQDEESPGRALLSLAEGSERTLRLPGGAVEVRCAVERYHLSAHADADQITGLVQSLRPRSVWIVHGDDGARRALATRLSAAVRARVELPVEGHGYEVAGSGRKPRAQWLGEGLSAGRELDQEGLRQVADLLLAGEQARDRVVTVEDIAHAWFGEHLAPRDVHRTRLLLDGGCRAFTPDRRRPYRYRPVPLYAPLTGPMSQAAVLAAIDEALPVHTGLVKRSLHVDRQEVVLSFALPDAQAPVVQPVMDRLATLTGWRFRVHPHPQQAALGAAFREVLPDRRSVLKGPSFVQDLRIVRARLRSAPEDLPAVVRRFRELTGWTLELEADGLQAPVAVAVPVTVEPATQALGPQEARPLVHALFADLPQHLRPVKVGYPEGVLRLHFIHPGMGRLAGERLAALESATGRVVSVHPHPVHQKLLLLVQERVPEDWTITRKPSWIADRDLVRIRVFSLPEPETVHLFAERILEEVGCEVVVEVDE